MGDDSIKVVVKVRPLIRREVDDRLPKLWGSDEHHLWPADSQRRDTYTFDNVFDENSTTLNLYDKVARPIVEATLDGINGTIFAYGQTSSGKTYTMMGNKESPGIIPLAVNNVFKLIESKSDRDFLIRVSFIEIYNEKIKDLLDLGNNEVKIREDYNNQISITCKEIVTTTPERILQIMQQGNQNRSVGETSMNDTSSRSHSIFQIIIESRRHASPGAECDDSVNVSQLNLVDLAGSERASQAGTTKQRLREGCHINKSLTALGVVIRQLSSVGDQGFVNFRDSKLTRILQSSLGGNAKTGIICAVTPTSLDETHSTLKFATCAKEIQNKPMVNTVVSDATQLKILTKQLESLQKEVQTKKNLEEDNQRLQHKISELRAQILMGIGEREPVQRNLTNRRWTYCGPELATIAEDGFQLLALKKDINGSSTFQRFSNISEKNESIISNHESVIFNTRSMSTPKIQSKEIFPENSMCIDDSISQDGSNGICSPTHKCFEIHRTPPCILKDRVKSAERELKKLEEMTSLERLHNPKEVELIKNSRELKMKLHDTLEELQKFKSSETELKATITDLINKRELADSNKSQFERKVEELKCENEGLIYQLESSKKNHKKREEELLTCLDEARRQQNLDKTQQHVGLDAKTRVSHIPILAESQRKGSADEIHSLSFVQQHPSFVEKENELREQIKLNNKFKQNIEELDFKLEVCNEKIAELSKKNIKYANCSGEADDLRKIISEKSQTIQEFVSQIESCKLAVQQTLVRDHSNEPLQEFDSTFEKFPEVQTLILKYAQVCKEVQENKCSCDTIKEKLVHLENVNNEMRTKMENLAKTIFELYPLYKLNDEDILDVKLSNPNISPFEYFKNLFENAQDALNVIQNLFEIDEYDLIKTVPNMFVTPKKNCDEPIVTSSPLNVSKATSMESTILEKLDDSCIQDTPNHDLCDSIKYLESLVSDFEDNLMKVLMENNSEISINRQVDESITDSCLPIFKNLCMKFDNTEYLHNLLLNELENRNIQIKENSITLAGENESLKIEIQECLQSVRELSIESEELFKKVVCGRNAQAMSHAEFSLMTSHFKAANHYHSSLHSACDLTLPYFREQLLKLQSCLQNQYIDNSDMADLLNASYDNLFSNRPEPIDESISIIVDKECADVLISDNKHICDELNAQLECRTNEIKLLSTSIEDLKAKIKMLEAENSTLSDQLMEYIEEADYLSNKKDVMSSDVGVNTTIMTNTRTSATSPMKIHKSIIMEGIEDNLKNIFKSLQIDFEMEEDSNISSKIAAINVTLEESIAKIQTMHEQQLVKNDEIEKLNIELKSLEAEVQNQNITEMELSCVLKSEVQKRDQLESEIAKLRIELQEIESNTNIEISQFKEDMEKLKEEIVNKNEICNLKNIEIEDLNAKINTLSAEILSKNNCETILEAEVEGLKKIVRNLDELQIAYDNMIRDMQNKDSEIAQISGELLKLTDLQESLKVQESIKDKQIQELRIEIQCLHDKLELKSNNEVQLNTEIENKVMSLQRNLELCELEKVKEIEALTNEITSMRIESQSKLANEHELNNLKTTISNLQECIELRESEIKQKNTDIDQLKIDLQSLLEKWEYQFNEKSKLSDEIIMSLQNEKKSHELEKNNFISEISSLKEQSQQNIKEYCKLIEDLNLKVSQLQSGIESYESQNSIKDTEIQKLKMEIIEFKQEIQSNINIKNSIKDYENVIAKQNEKLHEIHMNGDGLVKENNQLKQLLSNKQMETEQMNKYIIEFKQNKDTEVDKLKCECKSYMSQLELKNNSEVQFIDELRSLKVQKNLLESSIKTYQSENNEFRSKLQTFESIYKETVLNAKNEMVELKKCIEALKVESMNLKNEGDAKDKEINQLQTELKTLIIKVQTYNNLELKFKEINNNLKSENLKLEEKLAEFEKKVPDKNLGFGEMMEYFVDKVTHDMALEKNKQLQKTNDDLRVKAKEYIVEIRRLQHSLQNNTVNNLMPNDRPSNEQKEHVLLLESKLKEKDSEIRDLKTTYKELDEEYENFLKVLKDTESQCSDLYTENKILMARVANCEMELDECKENSQNQERRKKRQSLHDMNRGCYTGVNGSMNGKNVSFEKENSNKLELEKENTMLHKNINELQNQLVVLQKTIPQNFTHNTCQNCAKSESLKSECNRLKVRNSDLESRLAAQPAVLTQVMRPQLQPTYGSGGIVMNQKLCEYIAENQRLQDNNNKLKQLCRMRDKKIKDLEEQIRK
ncbi:CENP-meta [Arctopsyche grandis]|uniref:CENP-meta n=1 Tax=Arctopsyche grandis TaxID=121162 RepID=UPI00406D7CE0